MKYFTYLLILSLAACNFGNTTEQPSDQDITEVTNVLMTQLKEWNKGDIVGFMQGCWKSDELRFCTENGTRYGWDNTLAGYQKSFPNRDDMGKLSFEIDSIYTDRAPFISLSGNWEIVRQNLIGENTIGGKFILLFAKKDGEWKIIEDHTW